MRSNQINRSEALEILSQPPLLNDEKELKNYILDKLDLKEEEFDKIMKQENKNFMNFLTYYDFLNTLNFLQNFFTR